MPVYGDMRFLEAAVESVLTQDFSDFELIIVDDGGRQDAVMAKLSCRDPRIRIVINKDNLGSAAAANRGIEAARADILARLDADDLAESTRLRRLLAALDGDRELGLVGSWFVTMDESGRASETIRLPSADLAIRWCSLFSNPFCQSAIAFRRSCFEAAGRYRPELRSMEDYDLWSRMLTVSRGGNIPQALARYRLNSRGLTAKRDRSWDAQIDAVRQPRWDELGVAYDRDTANTLAIFVAGYDIPAVERRAAAYRTLLLLLSRFLAKQPLERAEDESVARHLVADTIRRIVADRSISYRALFGVWRSIRLDPIAISAVARGIMQRELRTLSWRSGSS
jgi:glycosyltransferase involved in cell wall biosynthesis